MVPSPAPEGTANGASLLTSNQLQSDIFKVDPKPTITSMEPTATERLQRLMRDCGYSTARLENMYSELPPRKLRDDLVDYYFTNMSVLAFVLDEWNHLLMNLTEIGFVIRYPRTSSVPPTSRFWPMSKTWPIPITSDSCRCYSSCWRLP